MTAIAIRPASTTPAGNRPIALVAGLVSAAILAALLRHALGGGAMTIGRNGWLVLHLICVLPAVPLGAYVLVRRKGDRLHRMLGRTWAMLMLGTALTSFGLHGMTGHLSWIHILSAVTLVTVPRGVWQAVRGNIAAHRRSMTLTYVGLLSAGVFAFVPGRLFGSWLFG